MMMWREESGILEMLFTYFRKYEKSEDWTSYREILIEILDCHEQYKSQNESSGYVDISAAESEVLQLEAASGESPIVLGEPAPVVKEEPAFFEEEDEEVETQKRIVSSITPIIPAPLQILPTTAQLLPTSLALLPTPDQLLATAGQLMSTPIILRTDNISEEAEESDKEDRPFGCPYCPKRFKQRSSVTRHAAVHLTVTYNCGLCHRVFNNLEERDAHQEAHTEQRKFCCSFCPLTFNHKCAMEAHERRHTRQKPYKCSFCGKAFSQRGNQKRHELIHTMEKPFPCRHCGRRFNQPSSRRAHERIHERRDGEQEKKEDVEMLQSDLPEASDASPSEKREPVESMQGVEDK